MRLLPAAVLLPVLTLTGCNERNPGDVVERDGEPAVQYFAEDDPRMTAAIEKARETVDEFITALDSPTPTQSGFSVKIEITEGENGEHMWLVPVRFENGQFHGTLNNEPDIVKSVKFGDEVSAAKDEISDWMFVEDNVLKGGYTLRVVRDGLSDEERAAFDASMPFTFE